MKNKKDLTKIALAAFILASTTPVSSHAEMEADGIVLAAGCAEHGCPASSGSRQNGNYQNDNNMNRPGSDFSNTNGYYRDYSGSNAGAVESNPSNTMTESQLLNSLNPQGKAIYASLNPEGKTLALQLASQDSYKDKNLAVKEAQRRMNDSSRSQNR